MKTPSSLPPCVVCSFVKNFEFKHERFVKPGKTNCFFETVGDPVNKKYFLGCPSSYKTVS